MGSWVLFPAGLELRFPSSVLTHVISLTFPEMSNFIGGGVLQGHGDLYIFGGKAIKAPLL
jgi:hypothetical protein